MNDSLADQAATPMPGQKSGQVPAQEPVADAQASQSARSEAALHELLTRFMGRLAQASRVSDSFHQQLEQSATRFEEAKSLLEVTHVMQALLEATKSMARDSLHVHDELQDMQERVHTTDQQIAHLHAELDRASVLARHDPLTGALNRKGLDEAVNREVSNVRRRGPPLSVALLDIDDFKRLNDRLGHVVGDAALRHLAVVARQCLRPQDTLARYGGEEFVLLLPDTPLEKGVEAMNRLQRELAARALVVANEPVKITFSAGVTQLQANEPGTDAIDRADRGMYLAKGGGKNQVVGLT